MLRRPHRLVELMTSFPRASTALPTMALHRPSREPCYRRLGLMGLISRVSLAASAFARALLSAAWSDGPHQQGLSRCIGLRESPAIGGGATRALSLRERRQQADRHR